MIHNTDCIGNSLIEHTPNLCTLVKLTFSELYKAMKKLSGKVDLAVYSYFVVVSG